jgi:hypothetical protein
MAWPRAIADLKEKDPKGDEAMTPDELNIAAADISERCPYPAAPSHLLDR